MSIFDCMSYDRFLICEDRWNKLIKPFNKNFKLYFEWIIPTVSDLEFYLSINRPLIIRECEVFKKIKIDIIEGIPTNVNKGVLMTVENLLLYFETEEVLNIFNDQTFNIQKTERNLSNERFVQYAKPEVVEMERKKLIDFNLLQQQNLVNKFFNEFGYDFILLLYKYTSLEKIYWDVQYNRELNTDIEEYSKDWFSYVYSTDLNVNDINMLLKKD